MRQLLCSLLLLLTGLFASAVEQRLANGDTFKIVIGGPPVAYTQDFALDYTVDGGTITLPVIGRIKAEGLTQSQLAADIEKRLKDGKIFTTPNVIISMQRTQQSIVVGGAVRSPGRQGWVPDMTLTQAIASAAGPSDFAKDSVRIVRNGKSIKFSRKDIRAKPENDPKILVGDYIDVEGDF